MLTTRFKTIAATFIALAALVTLTACGKKVEDTGAGPPPATTPANDTYGSSPSGASGATTGSSGTTTGISGTGTSAVGSGMPRP